MSASEIGSAEKVERPGGITDDFLSSMFADTPPNPNADSTVSEPERSEPTKAKRGRKAKAKEPFTPPLSQDALQLLFERIFDVVSKRSGDYWKLDETESALLGEANYQCLVLYGETFAKYLPVIALVSVWGIVLTPRVMEAFEQRRRKQPKTVVIREPQTPETTPAESRTA